MNEQAGMLLRGADTLGFEPVPSDDPDAFPPVHSRICSTASAQRMEVVRLNELGRAGR